MRQLLIGTTALVAVGLLTGGAAIAQEKKQGPLQLGLAGYFFAFGVAGSEDDGVGQPAFGRRGHMVLREAEVHFTGNVTFDNGFRVGVDVQLEAETCGDQVDESYLIFQHADYGRVQIGAENSAPYLMGINPPSVLSGFGLHDPTFFLAQRGGNAIGALFLSAGAISGDSEKLTYLSPTWAGFRFGLSYTPDSCEEGLAVVAADCGGSLSGLELDNQANQQSEIVEVGVRYDGKFGDVGVGIGGGYSTANNELATVGVTEDRTEWSAGAQIMYAGFTLAGSYRHDNLGIITNGDRTDWGVALGYSMAPWGFSIGYGQGKIEPGAGIAGEDEISHFEGAVAYTVGPGVTLEAGIVHWNLQDNLGAVANENSATFFVVGAGVRF